MSITEYQTVCPDCELIIATAAADKKAGKGCDRTENPASVECYVMCCMLWVVCSMWMCQKMNVTLSRRSAIWCSAVVSLDTCPRVSTSSRAPGTDRAQHRHTPANFLELELWSFRGPELRSAEGGLDLESRADHWRYLELDRASVSIMWNDGDFIKLYISICL